MDDATMKPSIASHLVERGIPFIDVGMGVEGIDAKLSGLLRMVFAAPDGHEGRRGQPTAGRLGFP